VPACPIFEMRSMLGSYFHVLEVFHFIHFWIIACFSRLLFEELVLLSSSSLSEDEYDGEEEEMARCEIIDGHEDCGVGLTLFAAELCANFTAARPTTAGVERRRVNMLLRCGLGEWMWLGGLSVRCVVGECAL
jgi:hypothetical protein